MMVYCNNSSGGRRPAKNLAKEAARRKAQRAHEDWLASQGLSLGQLALKKRRPDVDMPDYKVEQRTAATSDNLEYVPQKPIFRQVREDMVVTIPYNKGPYMVVPKADLQDAGKK